jgi:hypothetical protein
MPVAADGSWTTRQRPADVLLEVTYRSAVDDGGEVLVVVGEPDCLCEQSTRPVAGPFVNQRVTPAQHVIRRRRRSDS